MWASVPTGNWRLSDAAHHLERWTRRFSARGKRFIRYLIRLCLKIPLVWLALMLAAHWQTDWLVWEKEEGKGGRVDEWEKKAPSSDWQAGRTDGAQFFQAFSGGGSESLFSTSSLLLLSEFQGAPRLGPLDSLALYSASFQTSKKNPPTSARRSPTCNDGRARAPPVHLVGITCGTGSGLYWHNQL